MLVSNGVSIFVIIDTILWNVTYFGIFQVGNAGAATRSRTTALLRPRARATCHALVSCLNRLFHIRKKAHLVPQSR